MKRSETIKELAAALSKAQQAFTAAERDHTAKVETRSGGGYSFNYADLAAYLDVCRGPLGDNGLSFIQEPIRRGNEVTVSTLLLHASGEWIESEPLVMNVAAVGENQVITPQAIGSAITYARRYSLSALIGMASEADDDGNAASGNQAETGRREKAAKPVCPSCGKPDFVFEDKKQAGAFYCWKKPDLKKFGCGHQWAPAAPVDMKTRSSVMTIMQKAACEGEAAFKAAWAALTTDERHSVEADLDALKKRVLTDPGLQQAVKAWTLRIRHEDTNVKRLNEMIVELRKVKDESIRTAVFPLMCDYALENNAFWDAEKKAFFDNPPS